MFKVLGMAAALEATLRRVRFNFVPVNYVLIALAIGAAGASVRDLRARPSTLEPRLVSIADLAAGAVPARTFVTVEGRIDQRFFLEMKRTTMVGPRPFLHTTRTERLVPLVDNAGTAGILIASPAALTLSGRVRLTGMVTGLPYKTRDVLDRDAAKVPSRMNRDVMLEHGQRPPSLFASITTLAVCSIVTILLVGLRLHCGPVFKATTDRSPHPVDMVDDGCDVRVSGRFLLEGSRTTRRFMNVPAQPYLDPNGVPTLFAHVDASTYVFGWCLRARRGVWHVAIPHGALRKVVRGDAAFGTHVRAAAKLVVAGDRPETYCMTFGSAAQRERFLHALDRLCGSPAPRAMAA